MGFLALVALVMVVAAVIRHDRADTAKPSATRKDAKDAKDATGDPKGKGRPPASRPEPTETRETRRDTSDVDRDWTIAGLSLWGFICLLSFLYLLASVLLAIWVVIDARNRSVENGLIWMLLIFPFNFLATLIYMASRPAGSLIRCEHCRNKRLAYVGICPHCHQPVTPYGRVA